MDRSILSNSDILKLPQVPKSLVIVGAGAVGVEFASIFRSVWDGSNDDRDAAAHRAAGR